MKRVVRFLRSRKLAIWLLLIAAVYAAIAVSLAQNKSLPPAEKYWLGFGSPAFLLVMGFLTVSTALCAWERTVSAVRGMRRESGIPVAVVDRLERTQPAFVSGGSVEEARAAAAVALRDAGLRNVRSTARVVQGEGWRFGLLGSPIFHWSLALLFVVIMLGQATRSEGLMGVPVGAERPNASAEYGKIERGPLYPDLFHGIAIAVPRLDVSYVIDGVERGPAPTVELRRGDRLLRSGVVYPNRPLRYGPLLVHYAAYGYAGTFSLTGPDGSVLGTSTVLFDFSEKGDRLQPNGIELTGQGGSTKVMLEPVTRALDEAPSESRIKMTWTEGGVETSTVVAKGSAVSIGGASLHFDGTGLYARLSVVDDWSVYLIYSLLTLVTLGVSLSVFLPTKTAWVMCSETDGGTEIRYLVRHQRKDPVFAMLVTDALQQHLERPAEEAAQ